MTTTELQTQLESNPTKVAALQFIREFYADIPEERWTISHMVNVDGQCCALGHLGVRDVCTVDAHLLRKLVTDSLSFRIITINDDLGMTRLKGTPRQRMLNALDLDIELAKLQ